MTNRQEIFTWNVQLAGYQHHQIDQKGETNHEHFIKEFESFPWLEQLEKAKEHEDGVSPTVSIKDLKTGKDFFISIAGNKKRYDYIIGYIYPTEKKGFLGLGKARQVRWLKMYLTKDNDVVTKAIKLFFDRNYNELQSHINKLKDFGQMEAEDLAE